MKRQFVSFTEWPYNDGIPEESVEFAAHCCGCDAKGEPHPLAEVAESGHCPPPRKPPSRKRDLKLDNPNPRPNKCSTYAMVYIGDATIEGWVVKFGVKNVVIKSRHTRKMIEISREGVEFSGGPE